MRVLELKGSNGTGFNNDAYFQNTAWDMGYDNCQMGWGGSVESSFAYGCQYSYWMSDLDAVAGALGLQLEVQQQFLTTL